MDEGDKSQRGAGHRPRNFIRNAESMKHTKEDRSEREHNPDRKSE